MKRTLIFIAIVLSINIYSQDYMEYSINFDDSSQLFSITIDTSLSQNNIWQIGKPQKTIFNGAYSVPNVIVTDTINPYPPNDTSTFTITHVADDGFFYKHTVTISGYYKCDSDSTNDFGLIEFSPDNGDIWVDLINDTVYGGAIWWGWDTLKPVLTGLTTEWSYFFANISLLGYVFDITKGDTVLYRFSFISDSQAEQREGLMFDDLYFVDLAEGIDETTKSTFASMAYPNPAKLNLTIEFENDQNNLFDLTIFNNNGKIVSFINNIIESRIKIDTKDFSPDTYLYKLTNIKTKQNSIGKFMVK